MPPVDIVAPRALAHRLGTWAALIAITAITAISYAPWKPDAHLRATGDALQYYAMSEHTWAAVDNPFALRIVSPLLARLIHLGTGLSLDTSWVLLTAALIAATAILIFETARGPFKMDLFRSTMAAVAFLCTFWASPYALGNPYLSDPLNILLFTVAYRLVQTQRPLLFIFVVGLGSLNKETLLLAAPLYALWHFRRGWNQRVWSICTIAGPAIIYLNWLPWAKYIIGGDYRFGAGQANVSWAENIRFALSSHPGTEQFALYSVFGVFWIFAAYNAYVSCTGHYSFSTNNRVHLLLGWMFLACLAGRLFATDTERVFAMMAPMIVTMAVALMPRGSTSRPTIGVIVFLYAAVQLHWVTGAAALCADVTALILAWTVLPWNVKSPPLIMSEFQGDFDLADWQFPAPQPAKLREQPPGTLP